MMRFLGSAKVEEHHNSENAAQTIRATNDGTMINVLTITKNNTASRQVQLVCVITPAFNEWIRLGNAFFGLSDLLVR